MIGYEGELRWEKRGNFLVKKHSKHESGVKMLFPETNEEAWIRLFTVLDRYRNILMDIVSGGSDSVKKVIHEAYENNTFKYCYNTIKENIDIIIDCLKINQANQKPKKRFQKILYLFPFFSSNYA